MSAVEHHRGRPREIMVQVCGKIVAREMTPVYATAREAAVSGSGWLFWSEVIAADRTTGVL